MFWKSMENEPSLQDYRLRELYPKYYLYLGALAAISLSPNREWAMVYTERLEEIKQEIIANGGSINNNSQPPSGVSPEDS